MECPWSDRQNRQNLAETSAKPCFPRMACVTAERILNSPITLVVAPLVGFLAGQDDLTSLLSAHPAYTVLS